MSPRWKIAAALFALGLVAPMTSSCASPYLAPKPDEPIAITPETRAALNAYLGRVKVTRPGAFAVSPNGRNSFYTYCGNISCAVTNYSFLALRGCHRLSGVPCVILYVRDEPRLAFIRRETAAPGGRHGSERQREVDFDDHRR